MNFIAHLKKYYPELDGCLNKSEQEFGEEWERYQDDLPESFLNLYNEYDGENNQTPGIFAGFSWMSRAEVSRAQQLLADTSTTERYSNLSDQIQASPYRSAWIPFAHDYGGSYLAIDLEPGKQGTKGQIISLDRDSDEVYVVADSFDLFCQFIFESIANGKIIIEKNNGRLSFCWQSGHLLNDINSLHAVETNQTILLTGYWREYFKNKIKDDHIAISELEKLSQLVVNDRGTYKGPISFDILRHCTNLTELICHSNDVISFEPMAGLSKLKKFYVRSSAFTEESLRIVSACSSLRELGLISMHLDSLETLASLPIKILAIINTQIQQPESILLLKDLSELRIEAMAANSYDFISNLKKLKTLDLKKVSITNVGFLKNMKLTDLKINDIPVDNQYDELIANMPSLKETDWPFADLSVLRGKLSFKSIGIDLKKMQHPEALKETAITAVTLVNTTSEAETKSAIEMINQYRNLSSYGWTCNWKN